MVKAKAKATTKAPATSTALVNTDTGELSDFEQALAPVEVQRYDLDTTTAGPETDIVYIQGYPVEYRCDAKVGQFKLGEDEEIGRALELQILRCTEFEAELFKYPRQRWLQIFFVNEDLAVCHILIKGKETLRSFQQLLLKLRVARLAILQVKIVASWVKREADIKDKKTGKVEHVSYYSLEFDYTEDPYIGPSDAKEFLVNNKLINYDFEAALSRPGAE